MNDCVADLLKNGNRFFSLDITIILLNNMITNTLNCGEKKLLHWLMLAQKPGNLTTLFFCNSRINTKYRGHGNSIIEATLTEQRL